MARAKTGRYVTTLTPKLADELEQLLRRGHYVTSACAFVGIHRDTFYGWQERGHAARVLRDQGRPVPVRERRFLVFVDRVEAARDYGEAWLVEQTLAAAQNPREHGRWQAYMTVLERSRPGRWARRPRLEHSGPDGKPIPLVHQLDLSKLDSDERDALKTLLRQLVGSDGST